MQTALDGFLGLASTKRPARRKVVTNDAALN